MKQHPILSFLTPDPGEAPNTALLRRLRIALPSALPTPVTLDGLGLTVLLVNGTGLVGGWLASPGDEPAATSAAERAPVAPTASLDDPRAAAAPALVFLREKRPVAHMPLRVNARTILPRTGASPGAALEVLVLAYSITAEAMRGPQAGSSFVELCFRRIDRGSAEFMAPVARVALRDRLLATTGTGDAKRRRPVEASFDTRAESDDSLHLRGGLNWRLTHG